MASAVLGKVSPTPKGEYVSTQDYDRLDVVTYEGYPYLAKSNVPSGNLPTDELYWMPLLTGLDFAPGGYGLGGQVPLTTADAAVQTGFYRIWLENTLGYTGYVNLMVMNNNDQIISQTAFGVGNKVFLRIYYNTWSGWVDLSPSAFAPSGYGLGGNAKLLSAADNLDDIWECGYYAWYNTEPVNAPHFGGAGGAKFAIMHVYAHDKYSFVQEVTCIYYGVPNLTQKRTKTDTLLNDWEWVNPPMQLGVEYRTTERWQGNAVYCKLVDLGTLPASATSEKDIVFFAGSMAELVSMDVSTHAGSTWRTEDTRWSKYVYKDSAGAHIVIKATENVSGYSGFAVFKYTKN